MKGIAILAVIAGHSIPFDCLGNQLIHSFHMPLFFIVAGYLYKPNYSYKNKFISDFRRLIIPYLCIAICFTLYLLIKEPNNFFALKYSLLATFWATGWNHFSLLWSKAPHIGIAWFLPSLFWCRQVFNFIYTRTMHRWVIVIGISFIATITDYYLINLPLGLLTGFSAIIFYQIGNYAHSIKKSDRYWLILGAICWLLQLKYFGINMCFCFYGFYPVDVIGASFATAVIYYISCYFSNSRIGKFIGSIGKVSLYIYCFHAIENEIKPYEWLGLEDVWYIKVPLRATLCVTTAFAYLMLKERLAKLHAKTSADKT